MIKGYLRENVALGDKLLLAWYCTIVTAYIQANHSHVGLPNFYIFSK